MASRADHEHDQLGVLDAVDDAVLKAKSDRVVASQRTNERFAAVRIDGDSVSQNPFEFFTELR